MSKYIELKSPKGWIDIPNEPGKWYIYKEYDNLGDVYITDRFYVLPYGIMINNDRMDGHIDLFFMEYKEGKWGNMIFEDDLTDLEVKNKIRELIELRKTPLYKAIYGQ